MNAGNAACRCVLILGLSLLLPRAAASQAPLTAAKAVALALARNAELGAMAAEVRAAASRMEGASLLLQANPELGAALGARASTDSAPLEVQAEVSQQLEIFGQRAARVDIARASQRAAAARLKARRAEIAFEVREAFTRALAAAQFDALARQSVELAEQTARAAELRMNLGDSSKIELNTARVEVGRARREASLAGGAQVAAVSQLRLLLLLPAGTTLPLEGDLRQAWPIPAARDDFIDRALRNRADRASALHALDGARAQQKFAARDALPRPRIGVRYERDGGGNLVLGTLSFDLPVFNRNQAERGVAAAQREQLELAAAATDKRIEQEVLLAQSRLMTAQQAAQAFEGQVVAAMSENLSLIQTAYEAGKIDLFELLLIRRDTLEARRGHIETLAELRIAEAAVTKSLGLEE